MNRPHHANIVAAFIAISTQVVLAPGPRSTAPNPLAGRGVARPASQSGDSSTWRRIHSVMRAGTRPTRNTARQPKRGSTSALTAAASA